MSLDRDALKRFIEKHEGRRATRYMDSMGIPTVGVGFNLRRRDAESKIAAVGANFKAVLNGSLPLTDTQIDRLLEGDIDAALIAARRLVSGFDVLPDGAQMAVVDMIFNLGEHGFGQFHRFIAALSRLDFATAAAEMESSVWYSQVGHRGAENVALMRSLSQTAVRSPNELRYSRDHAWAKTEGTRVRVGITAYAQEQLHDVVFVELPKVGAKVTAQQAFGVVESVKAVADLFAPLSGEVVEVNADLLSAPEIINQDPYGGGWMIVIAPAAPDELNQLLSAALYEEFVAQA